MSFISVVVPTFHGKQYMKGIIDQIEACKRKLSREDQVELIFVNDDPQEALPADLSSEFIQIIILQTDRNRGIHGARVRGLETCSGDYVLFLDQDDQVHQDYLFSQLEKIGSHDGIVCQVIHEKKLYYNAKVPFHEVMSKQYMFQNGSPIISPGQVLLRRTSIPVLWTTHIMKYNGADDFLLWLCMLLEGKTFALNEQVLFEHVVSYENASLNSYHMMCSEEEAVHILQENYKFSEDDRILFENMLPKMRKRMLNNLDKFRKMFYVLDDWTASEENGGSLETYLTNQGIRRLAVYGYGPLGKRLLRQLDGSGICVSYLIDQNAAFLNAECPACMLEDDLEDVDAVIISLVQNEASIAEAIRKKLSARILTIGEIVRTIAVENSSV